MYKGDQYATQTLFFIDSRNEIYVDVGLDFPVTPLSYGEIQISKDIARSLNVGVGDKVSFKLYSSNSEEILSAMTLFALMTTDMDDVNIDFAKELILFEDDMIPFSDLMVRQN